MTRSTIFVLCAMLLPATCCRQSLPQGMTEDILLEGGWKIQSSSAAGNDGELLSTGRQDTAGWYETEVPSTVLGTLSTCGLYSDAFIGCNYHSAISRSEFDAPWWYLVQFDLPQQPQGRHVFLNFDGISYSAEVWLNGTMVASQEEMTGPFRQFSYDISRIVKEKNTLAVKVFRAQDGDFNIGFVDWNPRPADESMGIFRPVRLSFCDDVLLRNTVVRPRLDTVSYKEAWLTVEASLENLSDKRINGELSGSFEGRRFRHKVTLEPYQKKTVTITPEDARQLHVMNPRLWWCHNLGAPEMYSMDISFTQGGKVSGTQHIDFGIRDIRSYFTPEGHAGFILNGRKVLIRGAGWTDDIFLRNPHWRNDIETDYVRDMNLNTIRFENFWGTSQDIYDLCDRKGILALAGWSCFWEWEVYTGVPDDDFGCIKTPEDMELITESLRDQILWLRNHPSIIAWFIGSDKLPRPELERQYTEMLRETDDRPVITAAKALVSDISGPSGMKMAGPYDYQGPAYWYSKEAPGGAFGFNTETGIGAQIPVRESLEKMIPASEIFPPGKAYDFHCTTAGEAMHSLDVLKEALEARYSKADGLDGFLLRAHHLDYDGTRAMFEAFRVNTGRSTGIIQWMLNSAWPSLYWQLYDWYLMPCAGYWGTKKANAPQQLVYNYEDKHVYAVNDEKEDVSLTANMRIYDIQGQLIASDSADFNLSRGKSCPVFTTPGFHGIAFLFLSLADHNGNEIADNAYCISSTDDIHDWNRYGWIRTPLMQSADYTGLDNLAEAAVSAQVTDVNEDGESIAVTLENHSQTVAFFMCMTLKDAAGKPVSPAFWSDNLVSLPPGEKRIITCRSINMAEASSIEISGWNVPRQCIWAGI